MSKFICIRLQRYLYILVWFRIQTIRWKWDTEKDVFVKMGDLVQLRTQQRSLPREERQRQTIRNAGDLLQLVGETTMTFVSNLMEAS